MSLEIFVCASTQKKFFDGVYPFIVLKLLGVRVCGMPHSRYHRTFFELRLFHCSPLPFKETATTLLMSWNSRKPYDVCYHVFFPRCE